MNLNSSKNIIVGKETYYNGSCNLNGSEEAHIKIGNYCAFGPGLTIHTTNHDYNYPAMLGKIYQKYFDMKHPGESLNPTLGRTKGDVEIGNDVCTGDGVIILSGVKIGDGCYIGARSVVVKDIEPYSIAVGNPCKKVKDRYSKEVVNMLLELKWWNWNDEKIKRNKKFFTSNLNSFKNVSEILHIIKE